tara:strand:+ start:2628 stop:3242 length:615 start_codon:yes stop_codon:yes gene_type:complete
MKFDKFLGEGVIITLMLIASAGVIIFFVHWSESDERAANKIAQKENPLTCLIIDLNYGYNTTEKIGSGLNRIFGEFIRYKKYNDLSITEKNLLPIYVKIRNRCSHMGVETTHIEFNVTDVSQFIDNVPVDYPVGTSTLEGMKNKTFKPDEEIEFIADITKISDYVDVIKKSWYPEIRVYNNDLYVTDDESKFQSASNPAFLRGN